MGMMAHYSPFEDQAVAWAIARVVGASPPTATWSSPATVSFARIEALRGQVPEAFDAIFDAPREAGDVYFRLYRDVESKVAPDDEAGRRAAAEQRARIDAQPVPLPEVGSTVIVWLAGAAPTFTIPTPFMAPDAGVALESRWIAADSASIARVRQLLVEGPPRPPAPPGPPGPLGPSG